VRPANALKRQITIHHDARAEATAVHRVWQSASKPMSAGNAPALYERIRSDQQLTQELFRQALQDPSGALSRICELGDGWGLPVSRDEVKTHLASIDDPETKQWLLKARGGL
jgi:hypothetical protein